MGLQIKCYNTTFFNKAPNLKFRCSGGPLNSNISRVLTMVFAVNRGIVFRWQDLLTGIYKISNYFFPIRQRSHQRRCNNRKRNIISRQIQTIAVVNGLFDQIANRLIQMKDSHDAALPSNPSIVVFELVLSGSCSQRRLKHLYNE